MTINQPRWIAESALLLPTIVRLRVLRCVLLFVAILAYASGWRVDALLLLVAMLVNEAWIVGALLREYLRRGETKLR
jgi:hypothetical protein